MADDDTKTEALADDPRPDDLTTAKSLLLVNTGDGKGKSTAAFGVMLRALAMGWPVAVVQFLKSGDWKVGEEKMGRQLGVEWHALGEGFTWDSDNIEHDKGIAGAAWAKAKELIEAGEHKLVLLDEITYMLSWGWIDVDDVLATLANRPEHVNIVCTGRDAINGLIEIADTVTEMRNVKHAYDRGIVAKKGIDY
ncbi:MAG: cob(I)yrinic acid a,c-diamide adenosyltransferase [Acidimicrobiales bacterium]|nr:cob(I)yrinic acid a,c-diamide adenosyltransferase [Acidimicrobiales bacterium]